MINIIKNIKEKVQRKLFWLSPFVLGLISKEVKENKKWKNESKLVEFIIISWFKK